MNLLDSLVFGFVPYLLSVIMIYGILEKTKIFGTGKSASKINAIISIILSSYVFLGFFSSINLIIKTFLGLTLVLFWIFLVFVVYKTVFETKIVNSEGRKEKIAVFLVLLMLFIAFVLYIFINL